MKGKLAIPLSMRSDWATPQPLFDELDAEFHFTLDVCASPENAKCARYFTREDDGLTRYWGGEICWMNPPYGLALRRWMAKAHEAASLFGATVVCLVPARTDTRWWHDFAEKASERRFIRGRIAFTAPKAHPGQATFPSAVVVFRPALEPAADPSRFSPKEVAPAVLVIP